MNYIVTIGRVLKLVSFPYRSQGLLPLKLSSDIVSFKSLWQIDLNFAHEQS